MINQAIKLTGAGVLGVASVGVSISAPTLTNLGVDDLAAFSNGQRVEVTAYRPGRALAGGLGVAGLGLFGWWVYRELMEGDGTTPVQTLAADGEPVQGQFIQAPADVPAPEKYIDVSAILANQLRPTLITGNPRIGKGIVVVHGINQVKRRQPDCQVWLIQPKYHRNEHTYWEGCDRVYGVMLEDYIGNKDELDRIGREMTEFIHEWRRQQARPVLLVFDELSLVNKIMPKWYRDSLIPQIGCEMSSGETDSRAFWGITQSPLATDLGITKGERSTFDLLAIENPDSSEHLASLCASYDGVPKIEDPVIYRQSLSPKKAVFYHSSLQQWRPMLPYVVPSERNESSTSLQNGVTPVTKSREGDTGIQGQGPLQPLQQVTRYTIHQVLRVQQALAEGMSDSDIVKDVLGYKGRNYDEGKAILNEIKAIIEENS